MSQIAINRGLRASRRQLGVLAVMLALAGALIAHHSSIEHAGTGVMVMCLAVLPMLAVGGVARVVERMLRPVPRVWIMAWAAISPLAPPRPRARSSPVRTVVMRC